MYYAKLTIPKMSDTYKLYVYRSKSSEDINTISKIKNMTPIITIDESTAETQDVNGVSCYVMYDKLGEDITGITYTGPVPNIVPVSEYESVIDVVSVNDYTYANQLTLNPLPIKYNGTMLYYSVIGVDEANNLITHLSKVNGVMVDCDYTNDGTRHLYSCNNYTGENTDIWNYVSSVSWNENIKIGDVNDAAAIDRFGIPVIETVNIFSGEEINASLRPMTRNFMVLEIPNPWQNNNEKYNWRRLKSYKLQNVYDEQYSDFSEPTYQSLLPVNLEKMIILKKTDPDNPDDIISIEHQSDEDIEVREIIRRNGIYYDAKIHKRLGLNKYNIPLEEKTGVFSEASVQDQIKIQVEALPNHVYAYTFYLIDVYENISEPAHFVVRT